MRFGKLIKGLTLSAALLTSTAAGALADGALKLWYQVGSKGEIAALRAMVESFKEKHPDIALEVNEVDFETYRSLIRSAVASSDPPDVFKYWAGAWPQTMVESNLLENIDDFWAEQKLDEQFAGWAKDLNSYGGHIYGVPVNSFTSLVVYRKDIFDKLGITVPEDRWPSYEEFLGWAEKLKAENITPFSVAGGPMWPLQYWLGYFAMRMDGDELWNELLAGKANWTDPRVKAWFTEWAKLLQAGYFLPDLNALDYHEQQVALFEGRAAMSLALTGIYASGKAFDPEMDLAYFNFPVMDAAVPKMMHHQSDSFFVSANARNKENAKLWLEHASGVAAGTLYPAVGGLPGANINVPDDAFKFPLMATMNHDRNTYPGPISLDIGVPPPVAAEAMRQLQLFVTTPDEATIDTALAAIEAASRDYFDNL